MGRLHPQPPSLPGSAASVGIKWEGEHFGIYMRGAKHLNVITDNRTLERNWQNSKPPL